MNPADSVDPKFPYRRTFFPGVHDRASAATVTIHAGELIKDVTSGSSSSSHRVISWLAWTSAACQCARRVPADQDRTCRASGSPRVMPLLAQQMDKATLIRSVSYTPNGLFNHTAAMYQMLTGEQADKVVAVRPAGAAHALATIRTWARTSSKFLPPDVPMLPFVMLPRPLQESNVIGKAGTAGFLGKAYDPYYLYPAGARHRPDEDGPHQTGRLHPARRGLEGPHGAPRQSARSSSTTECRNWRRRSAATRSMPTTRRRSASSSPAGPARRWILPRSRRRCATGTAGTRSGSPRCWHAA